MRVVVDTNILFRFALVPISLLLPLAFVAFSQVAADKSENFTVSQMVSKDMQGASDRKVRSEKILKAQGVPVNNWLPVIEAESNTAPRPVEEIAYRCLALLVVAVKGESHSQGDPLPQEVIEQVIEKYQLETHFTPSEKNYINNPDPPKQDSVNFTWRYESAWTLLWALGYADELGKPDADSIADAGQAVRYMWSRTAEEFTADAQLRPFSEILDQADLVYRYNWAVVDARVKGQQPPSNLDSGITYERHYALNWLIGYLNQEWDDISTDT